jgi:hypothetical protein
MSKSNSGQQGNKKISVDTQAIGMKPYGQTVFGPDNKGNIFYGEYSAAPMKSRVVTVSETGEYTDYVNQTYEIKAGDQFKEDGVCILIDAVNGKIVITAEKSSIDLRARENINLHAEKGDINFHAPNGKIVLSSKELRTGDLAGGTKPLIRMNSKDGGNFCGSKLPHKFCWDFVGTSVAPGSWSDRLKNRRSSNAVQSTASALSAIVTSTTDSLARGAAATVGRPYIPGEVIRPYENPNVQAAWPRLDRENSPGGPDPVY